MWQGLYGRSFEISFLGMCPLSVDPVPGHVSVSDVLGMLFSVALRPQTDKDC